MAVVTSNYAAIAFGVSKIADVFNLKRSLRRGGRTLGDAALNLIATNIRNRTLNDQTRPDGNPLAKNRGAYGRRKRAKGIKIGVGLYGRDEVGGDMLKFDEILGITAVSKEHATMIYGTNEADRQKAEWFQDPERAGQPPRPFYELSSKDERDLGDFFDDAAESYFEDLERGGP